jgi:hypothetical protein
MLLRSLCLAAFPVDVFPHVHDARRTAPASCGNLRVSYLAVAWCQMIYFMFLICSITCFQKLQGNEIEQIGLFGSSTLFTIIHYTYIVSVQPRMLTGFMSAHFDLPM